MPVRHVPPTLRLVVVVGVLCASAPHRSAIAQPVPASALEHHALPNDTIIGGIPCARTGRIRADFYHDGRLAGCLLATDHSMAGHRFPRGSWLDVNPQGVLWAAWLSSDTELGGHRCLGDGYKKWSVRFHPNGALQECFLARDAVVDGAPCMRGSFYRDVRSRGVALHLTADGRLARCIASHDTVITNVRYRTWQVVRR
jgi:hypothetical protein